MECNFTEKEQLWYGRELHMIDSLCCSDSQNFTKELKRLLIQIPLSPNACITRSLLKHDKYINSSSELTLLMLES